MVTTPERPRAWGKDHGTWLTIFKPQWLGIPIQQLAFPDRQPLGTKFQYSWAIPYRGLVRAYARPIGKCSGLVSSLNPIECAKTMAFQIMRLYWGISLIAGFSHVYLAVSSTEFEDNCFKIEQLTPATT